MTQCKVKDFSSPCPFYLHHHHCTLKEMMMNSGKSPYLSPCRPDRSQGWVISVHEIPDECECMYLFTLLLFAVFSALLVVDSRIICVDICALSDV